MNETSFYADSAQLGKNTKESKKFFYDPEEEIANFAFVAGSGPINWLLFLSSLSLHRKIFSNSYRKQQHQQHEYK